MVLEQLNIECNALEYHKHQYRWHLDSICHFLLFVLPHPILYLLSHRFPYICDPPFLPTPQAPYPFFTPTPWLCVRALHLCVGELEAKIKGIMSLSLGSSPAPFPILPSLSCTPRVMNSTEVPRSLYVASLAVTLPSGKGVTCVSAVCCKSPRY